MKILNNRYAVLQILTVLLTSSVCSQEVKNDSLEALKKRINAEVQLLLKDSSSNTFGSVEKIVTEKYGSVGEEVFLKNKALLFYMKKEMDSFVDVKNCIHLKFPESTSLFDMNNDAWVVFQNTKKPDLLNSALVWSKEVIEKEPTATHYDTYANLLYKLGKNEEAIYWQEKGLKLEVGNSDKEEILTNLEKMKKGIPTW